MCPQTNHHSQQGAAPETQAQDADVRLPAIPKGDHNPRREASRTSTRWHTATRLAYAQLDQHLGNWQGQGLPPTAFCEQVLRNVPAANQLLQTLRQELHDPGNREHFSQHLQMYAAISCALASGSSHPQNVLRVNIPQHLLRQGQPEAVDPFTRLAQEQARAAQMTAVPPPVATPEFRPEPAFPPDHAGLPPYTASPQQEVPTPAQLRRGTLR